MLRTILTIALLPFLVLSIIVLEASSAEYEFITDKETFMAQYQDLMTQKFADFDTGPGGTQTCPGVLNSSSNNQCVTPGTILPGLELVTFPTDSNSFRIYEENFGVLGNLRNSLVANNLEPVNINFLNDRYNVVALYLGCAQSGTSCTGTVDVEVFDFSPVIIGSTSIEVTSEFDTFLGITSPDPISRVRISTDTMEQKIVVGLSAVSFGMPSRNIPTLSEWGLIAMASLIGIAGLLYIRKRQAAA